MSTVCTTFMSMSSRNESNDKMNDRQRTVVHFLFVDLCPMTATVWNCLETGPSTSVMSMKPCVFAAGNDLGLYQILHASPNLIIFAIAERNDEVTTWF